MLTVNNHSRDSAGLTYVYPVISRRANGLSIGINLNPNNACNWRCIYCQVPDLSRGSAPEIDLHCLKKELRSLLVEVQQGDFYERFDVPESQQQIRDIAISGNGEPTSAQQFKAVIDVLENVLLEVELLGKLNIVVITNGSLVHQARVQSGLTRLAEIGGEVWFKLDRATDSGLCQINNAAYSMQRVKRNLEIALSRCPVWIQTCLFSIDGEPPSSHAWQAYLDLLDSFQRETNQKRLRGVLLYGLARPSMQPEAQRLKRLSEQTMQQYADSLHHMGYQVKLNW